MIVVSQIWNVDVLFFKSTWMESFALLCLQSCPELKTMLNNVTCIMSIHVYFEQSGPSNPLLICFGHNHNSTTMSLCRPGWHVCECFLSCFAVKITFLLWFVSYQVKPVQKSVSTPPPPPKNAPASLQNMYKLCTDTSKVTIQPTKTAKNKQVCVCPRLNNNN